MYYKIRKMFSEKVFVKRCVDYLRGYYYNDDDEVKIDMNLFINVYLPSNMKTRASEFSNKIFEVYTNYNKDNQDSDANTEKEDSDSDTEQEIWFNKTI